MVEQMRQRYPHVTFVKVDLDSNSESPARYGVSAVPTFHLFKSGAMAGEVRGANPSGVEDLLRKA